MNQKDIAKLAYFKDTEEDEIRARQLLNGIIKEARIAQAAISLYSAYGKLHDGLSDMIEGGRLTEADIPDDYKWLIFMLKGECNQAMNKAERGAT